MTIDDQTAICEVFAQYPRREATHQLGEIASLLEGGVAANMPATTLPPEQIQAILAHLKKGCGVCSGQIMRLRHNRYEYVVQSFAPAACPDGYSRKQIADADNLLHGTGLRFFPTESMPKTVARLLLEHAERCPVCREWLQRAVHHRKLVASVAL